MRDYEHEDSSAGSTPRVESFSPSGFFADEDVPPTCPPPAGEDFWKHLENDGWFFSNDNNNHNHNQQQQQQQQQQQLQEVFRAAASDPLVRQNTNNKRPPLPLRGSSSAAPNKRNPRPITIDRFHPLFQECDDSVGYWNSVVQSLASEYDKDEISSTESGESEIQSDLPANEKRPPEIGMEFSTEEEAYKFYKRYADEVGFSVRKGKVQRLTSGAIRKRNFLCSRQGFKLRKPSDNNDETTTTTTATKYKRKETRTGCNASIQFTVEEGMKWVVSNFVSEHNHELEELKKEYRLEEEGIDVMAVSNTQQQRQRPHDVQALMNCFIKYQAKDPSFFYGIQVDAENRSTNFFWRDFRSFSDYSHFKDVAVFDTTLRSDNVVCASFWGLNHHRQRTSFGYALLLDKTLKSLIWLFRVFAVAMDDCPPETLYTTDESREIAIAVKNVFPKTNHRLGVNNILKKAKRRLSGYFEHHGFEDAFKECMLEYRSKEEFESKWDLMLARFNLRDNSWLVDVYNLWDNWSHFSGKKTFSAGIEILFDSPEFDPDFRKPGNEIMYFHDIFQKCVNEAQKLRSLESRDDIVCGKKSDSRSRKAMEKHGEDVYTSTIFKQFQEELLDSLSLDIEEVTSSSNISTFRLKEEGQEKEDEIVTFESSNTSVACSCRKFECVGILCGHCLKVLNAKKVFHIPPQYILKRWTKSSKIASENQRPSSSSYSRNIMQKTLDLISKSKGIEESQKLVDNYIDLAIIKAEEILKGKGLDQIRSKGLEIDEDTSCAVDGIHFLRNKKTISKFSLANVESA